MRKANNAVINFADRKAEEMIELHGGEALHCLHSLDDPRGCGFGPSCQSCVVRLTVLDTFETGANHHGVVAIFPFAHRGRQNDQECSDMTFIC